MEHVCRNCRLYNPKEGVCGVSVIIKGESYELPVLPNDHCHWERVEKEVSQMLESEIDYFKTLRPHESSYFLPKLEEERDKKIEVKQIRMWSDGKNGYIEQQE